MTESLKVPAEWVEKLAGYLAEQGLSVRVDAVPDHPQAGDRPWCDGGLLRPGGLIACATAWEMAGRAGIDRSQMGRLLDFLGIKVRNCQLGCF